MSPDLAFRVFLVAVLFVASTEGWRARKRGDIASTTYWMLVWLGGILIAIDLP